MLAALCETAEEAALVLDAAEIAEAAERKRWRWRARSSPSCAPRWARASRPRRHEAHGDRLRRAAPAT